MAYVLQGLPFRGRRNREINDKLGKGTNQHQDNPPKIGIDCSNNQGCPTYHTDALGYLLTHTIPMLFLT
jgi:hypothetical protein